MTFQCAWQALTRILVFILLLPIVIVFFCCIWIYRKFVSILYKICAGSKGGRVLGAQSSMYYCEHKNGPVIVQLQFKIDGAIDFQAFRDQIHEKVVQAKNSNGTLDYPELRQQIRPFLGYYFWTVDEFFDIKDHVICYEDMNLDCELALPKDSDYCEKLAIRINETAIADDKSPWLILVVNDVQLEGLVEDRGTLIIFRFAHYLADGYSIFQLISKCTDESKLAIYQPKPPSKYESFLQHICCPFSRIIESARKSANFDSDEFWSNLSAKVPIANNEPLSTRPIRRFTLSRQISTVNIHRVASLFGASFSSVFLFTFQNGIQTYFQKHSVEIPDQWTILLPVPSPNHGPGLTNDVYFIIEDMTIKGEQFEHQFKNYHHRLNELKNSSSSLANGVILSLMGLLPIQLRGLNSKFKFLMPTRKYFVDTFFLTFPGPTTKMHLLGKSVAEINFLIKGRINSSLTISMFIFNGKLQFWLGALAELFTNQQTIELMENIQNEFNNLSHILNIQS